MEMDRKEVTLNPNSKPFTPRTRRSSLYESQDSDEGFTLPTEFKKLIDLPGYVRSTLPPDSNRPPQPMEGFKSNLLSISGPKRSSTPNYASVAAKQSLDSNSNLCPRNSNWKIGILEFPEDLKNDFGLRSLAKSISISQAKPTSLDTAVQNSYISKEDVGFSDEALIRCRPLYKQMESPFDIHCSNLLAMHPDIPTEYLKSGKLPQTERLSTELLFFLFYTCPGDALQLMAGSELFDRGWRYNKVTQYWIGRFPSCPPEERTDTYEKGHYQHFNVRTWTREKIYLTLRYEELMEKVSFSLKTFPNLCNDWNKGYAS